MSVLLVFTSCETVEGCLLILLAIALNDSPLHIPVSIAILSDRVN